MGLFYRKYHLVIIHGFKFSFGACPTMVLRGAGSFVVVEFE